MSLGEHSTATADSREVTADIARRNAMLRSEIVLVRAGLGRTRSLWRTLRESVLYCPRSGEDGLLGADRADIHWVFAFTSLEELSRFAMARGPHDAEVDYLTVRGDRLIALLLKRVEVTDVVCGLAVDVSGAEQILLPLTAELLGADGDPVAS